MSKKRHNHTCATCRNRKDNFCNLWVTKSGEPHEVTDSTTCNIWTPLAANTTAQDGPREANSELEPTPAIEDPRGYYGFHPGTLETAAKAVIMRGHDFQVETGEFAVVIAPRINITGNLHLATMIKSAIYILIEAETKLRAIEDEKSGLPF